MPALISCTSCNQQLRVPEMVLGQTVKCPHCNTDFVAQENGNATPIASTQSSEPSPSAPLDENSSPVVEVNDTAVPSQRTSHANVRPWYLFLLALLPLGIPLAMLAGRWVGMTWLTIIFLGGSLTIGLVGLGTVLSSITALPVVVRVMGNLGLTGLGYLAVFLFLGITWFNALTTISPEDWKEFSSEEGRFSILMPGTPEEEQGDVGGARQRDVKMFSVQRKLQQQGFMVSYSDLPGVDPEGGAEVKILDSVSKNALQASKGKLIREKTITLDGIPGQELEIQVPDNGFIITRQYLFQTRLYQITLTSLAGRPDPAVVAKFFDSFKIQGQPRGGIEAGP